MTTNKQKKTLKEKKKLARLGKMENNRGDSKYARKREFLVKHGGRGVDYEEKPWR